VAAEAGMENSRFALDYKPKFMSSKTIPFLCDKPATITEEPNYSPNYTNTRCDQYTVDHCPLGPGQVYLVIGRAGSEGVAAASFGVDYGGSAGSGVDPQFVSWTPCADGLAFPNNDGTHGDFPQPGGGLRITWDPYTSCQTEIIGALGVHAVVGVFYVYAYSDDVLYITTNNNLESAAELAVANCTGAETVLSTLWPSNVLPYMMGSIGFGTKYGRTPCIGPDLARSTTWGRMKSTYKVFPSR
jgi:hypothetical protein